MNGHDINANEIKTTINNVMQPSNAAAAAKLTDTDNMKYVAMT